MSAPIQPARYKLVFTVPHSSLGACKEAVFETGAGCYPDGKYSHVCFETPGVAEFLPHGGAKPAIGVIGQKERVEEMKVEIMCVGENVMVKAVEALKRYVATIPLGRRRPVPSLCGAW